MRKAVHELLNEVNKNKKQVTEALKAAWLEHPRLGDILYYGLSEHGRWDLPEGEPPYKATDEVNTHSLMWSEARRLYLFHAAKEMRPAKRQELFIQTLEFVHPRDAELLLAIKDGKWPYKNITADVVESLVPGFLAQRVTADGSRVTV